MISIENVYVIIVGVWVIAGVYALAMFRLHYIPSKNAASIIELVDLVKDKEIIIRSLIDTCVANMVDVVIDFDDLENHPELFCILSRRDEIATYDHKYLLFHTEEKANEFIKVVDTRLSGTMPKLVKDVKLYV